MSSQVKRSQLPDATSAVKSLVYDGARAMLAEVGLPRGSYIRFSDGLIEIMLPRRIGGTKVSIRIT